MTQEYVRDKKKSRIVVKHKGGIARHKFSWDIWIDLYFINNYASNGLLTRRETYSISMKIILVRLDFPALILISIMWNTIAFGKKIYVTLNVLEDSDSLSDKHIFWTLLMHGYMLILIGLAWALLTRR